MWTVVARATDGALTVPSPLRRSAVWKNRTCSQSPVRAPSLLRSRHTRTSARSSTRRENRPASFRSTGRWGGGIGSTPTTNSRRASGFVRASAVSSPSASMSSAPLEPMWATRSVIWAGQDSLLGQRRSTSPSLAGASGVPHEGQRVGIENSRSVPSRSATTGATISGITSPALRSTTTSPIRTPFLLTSEALWSVAVATVEPETRTGSITPNGVTLPVLPTWVRMSSSRVLTSSGGYL